MVKTFIFMSINSFNGKGHFGLVVNGLRVTKGVEVRISPSSRTFWGEVFRA